MPSNDSSIVTFYMQAERLTSICSISTINSLSMTLSCSIQDRQLQAFRGKLLPCARRVGRLRLRRAPGFDAESLRILGVQAWPTEFHRFATDDAPERLTGEESLEHVEADMPARCTHRYETAIDVVPKRETRAVAERLKLPSNIIVAPTVLE
jgi:hypothetical protein